MNMPRKVRIVEVGPRDGLQNEPGPIIPTAVKIAFIERLANCGLRHIEAASFVSAKWVPQMGDADQVMAGIARQPGITYAALTPNMKGLENAIRAKVDEVAVFGAASETFSQKNINCSISESLNRYAPVVEAALENGMRVRAYVSTVLGCPYEGEVNSTHVAAISRTLFQMGCYEVSLGDTIGVGTPLKAKRMLETVVRDVPLEKLAAHFHDTYGQALVNLYAVMEEGISVIDASVAGLGGCPYARGAAGNVATEDVVYMLDGLQIDSGIDLDKLVLAGQWITEKLGRGNGSKVALAQLDNG
ncbi:MAG: hydroxymethylglutaryl-CoA lyase [Candidatus Thiodiazotropha sp.]